MSEAGVGHVFLMILYVGLALWLFQFLFGAVMFIVALIVSGLSELLGGQNKEE